MWRLLLVFCAALVTLNAGVLIGARYGIADQKGSYKGVGTEKDDKRPWGAGLALGYMADNFRVIGTYDEFDKSKKASLTTIGAHLIDPSDEFIHGFLGIDAGSLNYRHKEAPKAEDITFGGLSIGIILLDNRFPNMQMEIAYRYLKRFGSEPSDLSVKDIQHLYLGLSFNIGDF
ncbi:MAG: hypothetical protein LBP89_07850 [Helicobacteraceae bacterium]|jgi:hypothetical protein|nr:hypothetical protein [Helicobacteraceae bacterium]